MSKSRKIINEIRRAQKHRELARFYNLNSILGNDWAVFYPIIGGRMTGKSYSITDFLCGRKKKLGDQCKNYWMRISERSTQALLLNKADKLVDPDLKRKYKLDLTTKGFEVYDKNRPDSVFMTVVPLSSFGKLKGVGFYDKDYTGEYNIVLDEFQLEIGEKRTSFDILYNFIGMCENILRTTKIKVRVFLAGNTLEESSSILKAFNFLPEKFGRFYLKSKRCVIDNLEPTEEYLKDRKGSVASLLGGDDMSNYCNDLKKDKDLITKQRLHKPTALIKFSKDTKNWYTVWDSDVIRRYKGEHVSEDAHIAMRPYLDTVYLRERMLNVVERYDARAWKFTDLIAQSYFQGDLSLLRTSR